MAYSEVRRRMHNPATFIIQVRRGLRRLPSWLQDDYTGEPVTL